MMPHIVWYREHDEQQMNDNRTDPFSFNIYYYRLSYQLNIVHCIPFKNRAIAIQKWQINNHN